MDSLNDWDIARGIDKPNSFCFDGIKSDKNNRLHGISTNGFPHGFRMILHIIP